VFFLILVAIMPFALGPDLNLLARLGPAILWIAALLATLLGLDLPALGIPSRSAYVDAYVARTGLDPRPFLPVYSAYNFFRIAAILQGIVGRVRDGTATNENAPARAQMVRPLSAKAWSFAREAGAH